MFSVEIGFITEIKGKSIEIGKKSVNLRWWKVFVEWKRFEWKKKS